MCNFISFGCILVSGRSLCLFRFNLSEYIAGVMREKSTKKQITNKQANLKKRSVHQFLAYCRGSICETIMLQPEKSNRINRNLRIRKNLPVFHEEVSLGNMSEFRVGFKIFLSRKMTAPVNLILNNGRG